MFGGGYGTHEPREVRDIYEKLGRRMMEGGQTNMSIVDLNEFVRLRKDVAEFKMLVAELRADIQEIRSQRSPSKKARSR